MQARGAGIIYLLTILVLLGCLSARETRAENDTRLPVFVSILPQAFFVERIGGNRVTVDVMVQPGQSPHTYAPSPKQMVRLARAKVYFRINAPFENGFIPKLQSAVPGIEIIDTTRGIVLEKMDDHNNTDDHHHDEDLDTHIWLDPLLVKKQAAIIRDGLSAIDPAGRLYFENNFIRFAGELDNLHNRLSLALAPLKGKSFFVFHPAFGYFAKAYGLRQVAVETGGKQPSARHIAQLIEKAREEKVKVIFAQPQFSTKSAETIARAIDGVVIALDPLAGDYLANMEKIAAAMEKALQ